VATLNEKPEINKKSSKSSYKQIMWEENLTINNPSKNKSERILAIQYLRSKSAEGECFGINTFKIVSNRTKIWDKDKIE